MQKSWRFHSLGKKQERKEEEIQAQIDEQKPDEKW